MDEISSIVASLENAPSLIVPLVRKVPVAFLKRRPEPGKWSAHEHACHLAAVDSLIFLPRLEKMLAEDHPTIVPYNPGKDDPADALMQLDLDEALERYQRQRKQLVERVKQLAPADWLRTAEHGE